VKLRKYHGLGNDYFVLEDSRGITLTPELVVRVCHRHTGAGSDGILELVESEVADFGLIIHNPDGSQAEKSGNGLRIFARWLADHRDAGSQFTVEVPAGVVGCSVGPKLITVEMGVATFEAASVPVSIEAEAIDYPHPTLPLSFTAVGMGNPHCVVFCDEPVDSLPWRKWGAQLERDPLFPNRTNVQFVNVVSNSDLEIRVWERGAGETLASGSSSCAVVAAALKQGLIKAGKITVHMLGGELSVTIKISYEVTLTGPVEFVALIDYY
jgi:diaminopimelate epimerase